MAPLTEKPNLPQRPVRPRATDSSWLWLGLAGGSLAIHGLAAILVLPLLGQVSAQTDPLQITSIDFVEIPNSQAAPAKAIEPAAEVPALSQPTPAAASQPVPDDIAIALPVSPAAPSDMPFEPPSSLPPEPPESLPEASAPASDPPIAPPAPAEPALAEPVPAEAAPAQPQQPAAPLVQTLPIDTAVPDTSETLPPSQVQPESFSLVATLQVADVPPDQVEAPPPDAVAQPKVMSYRFAPDPQSTVCIADRETARLIQIGAPVAVQVSTSETGQVVDAALWQPSENPLNDQLATCLVKNWGWGFEPAIAQGQPVASKALILWVTIDQT